MNINPHPADNTASPTAGAAAASLVANNSTASMALSINMADQSNILASTIPNSKPREQPKKLQTYIYQDFANAEPSMLNSNTCHERVPPQSLQSQKLPSKLAAMLSDPDLASIITWMPHGRSWKILNRELFSTYALPRYFGHSNHASFVRIVNAWGFRRITKGPDRDSYYHELFLRGKPRLHERMKRLPTCHRKTPVDKDDKCPDFYELAKTSPLPDVAWSFQGPGRSAQQAAAARTNTMNQLAAMNQAASASGQASGYGNMTGAGMGMGMGLGSQMMGAPNMYGAPRPTSTPSMDMYGMSQQGGGDMSNLLKMLRQQQQPQQGNANMNQNFMQQFLSMQQQQQPSSSPSPNTGSAGLGQFANAPTSSNTASMLNSFTSGMSGMASHQQQPPRRPSDDKISVNDVIQLRSIERTNELLAQKLALMQQDTQMMKQTSVGGGSSGGNTPANPVKTEASQVTGSGPEAATANPTKEEMLLQMIRRESQMNNSGSGTAAAGPAAATKLEGNGSGASQGLNNFLQSLNQQ